MLVRKNVGTEHLMNPEIQIRQIDGAVTGTY